jgi:hypothetical protein
MIEMTGSAERRQIGPPSPDAARGTLSEAWFRALYGHESKNAENAAAPPARLPADCGASVRTAASHTVAGASRAPQAFRADVAAAAKTRALAVANVTRLRAQKLPSAGAPARAAQTHAQLARRSACRLELPGGSVDLLLQRRGNRVHLVALGEGALGSRVASALRRARAALLAHGLRLDAYTIERGAS